MKHVCFLLTLLFLTSFAFSQTEPIKTKSTVSKPATLKMPAESKVIERIPDLKIISANVVATSTGPDAYTLTITTASSFLSIKRPIFIRGVTYLLLEQTGKMLRIFESQFIGNLAD